MYPDDEIKSIFYLVAGYLLNYSKIDIHLNAHRPILNEKILLFDEVLSRLMLWEPVQYILEEAIFYDLTFRVNRNVLIPRQETELLVNWIIENEKDNTGNILDIGTGSGCIAVSLADRLSSYTVSACDVNREVLKVAALNAEQNKVNVNFFEFNILNGASVLPEKYAILVSNPPYVTNAEKKQMLRNVTDYEPEQALFVPDADPLIFYRNIILLGRKYIKDGGTIYFEINEQFPQRVTALLKDAGFYGIEVKKDLNGKMRMVKGKK